MNFIKQIIASFVIILVLIITGLSLNLNRLLVLTSSHHDIEEEWEELQHAGEFQDAINNLIYDISLIKKMGDSDLSGLKERLSSVKDSFSSIKLCSLNLFGADEESHKEADEHIALEEEKINAIKEKVTQFIKDSESFEAASLTTITKKEFLQSFSEQLFEVKLLNLQLQKVYSDGVISALNTAQKSGKQVENQIKLISTLIILIVALAFILTVIFLRVREVEMLRFARNETIGLMAKTFAHEIRNPLGIIKSAASVLQKEDEVNQKSQELLQYMMEEVDRIDGLLSQLQNFGKNLSPKILEENILAVMNQCITLISGELRKNRLEIEFICNAESISLFCDRDQIKQMMLNLLLNAIQASPSSSKIVIGLTAENNHVEITVKDFGAGINKKDLAHIFEPFFTTRASGSGVGLAVVKSIVENHHGKININSDDRGTIFKITFPQYA